MRDPDIWVEFNDIDEDGRTATLGNLVRRGTVLSVGTRILAGDREGNQCDGEVVELRPGGIVVIALDLATFQDGPGSQERRPATGHRR